MLADNYQGKRLNSPNYVVPFRLARLTADESLALTVPTPLLMGHKDERPKPLVSCF